MSNLPQSPVEQLKEELRAKKMLFGKSQLQLGRVVGQGTDKSIYSIVVLSIARACRRDRSGIPRICQSW